MHDMQERQMAVRAIGEIYFIHRVTLLNGLTLFLVRVGVNRCGNRKNRVVKGSVATGWDFVQKQKNQKSN